MSRSTSYLAIVGATFAIGFTVVGQANAQEPYDPAQAFIVRLSNQTFVSPHEAEQNSAGSADDTARNFIDRFSGASATSFPHQVEETAMIAVTNPAQDFLDRLSNSRSQPSVSVYPIQSSAAASRPANTLANR
jgi:hypothetical protein